MAKALIRQADVQDAPRLLEIYAPYVTDTNISFEVEIPTVEEFARRIDTMGSYFPYLVCEREGEILGYAYAHRYHAREGYRFDAELTVYVAGQHRRKGVGKALYTVLFTLLEEQGFYNAYAAITGRNERSVAMHAALGFTQAGVFHRAGYKRGRWEDVVWMEKPLRDFAGAPAPTKSIAEIDRGFVRAVLESCAQLVAPGDL